MELFSQIGEKSCISNCVVVVGLLIFNFWNMEFESTSTLLLRAILLTCLLIAATVLFKLEPTKDELKPYLSASVIALVIGSITMIYLPWDMIALCAYCCLDITIIHSIPKFYETWQSKLLDAEVDKYYLLIHSPIPEDRANICKVLRTARGHHNVYWPAYERNMKDKSEEDQHTYLVHEFGIRPRVFK